MVRRDRDVEVISALEIHPKAVGRAEGSRQSQRRVGPDRALAVDDFVDSSSGRGDGLREAVLGDAHRGEELLEEDLPGVDRVVCGSHDVSSLVVVGDLDAGRSGRCPGEADAPLVVDADAALPLAVCNSLEVGAEFADMR